MKKMRGIKNGYIGKSQYLALDSLEAQNKAQQARLEKLIQKLKGQLEAGD